MNLLANEDSFSGSRVPIEDEIMHVKYTMRANDYYLAHFARLRLDPRYEHLEFNVIDPSIPVFDRLFTVVHSRLAHS